MPKFIFLSFVITLLSACAGPVKKTDTGFVGHPAFNGLYSSETPAFEYILAHCKIYGLKDHAQHTIEANECAFPKNGDQLIYKRYFLDAFGPDSKKLWTIQNLSLHHQIEFADNEKEILLMDWDYWKDSENNCYRFDRLLVVDRNGKEVHSLTLKDLVADPALSKKLKVDKESACEKAFRSNKRLTRITAFKGLKTNGAASGYYTYDLANSVLYLFDRNLKLQKKISFTGRSLQSPEQISDSQFVFYEIVRDEAKNSQSSQLVIFSQADETTMPLYKSPVNIANPDFCGGLMYRGDHTLIVSHSDCTMGKDTEADLKIEVLDLNKRSVISQYSVPKLTPYGLQPFYPPQGFWNSPWLKK
ncbi:MAG: hypothetical protein K0R29_2668 [Pseudobdellovibrio sp.]|nr:hypothetical protein [Pseudobdellovibrio sp.]